MFAQDQEPPEEKGKAGTWFAYWGWNRGFYSKSDITFTGDGYDFVLKDVVAHDRQTLFGLVTYLNPRTLTIPQTNMRLGYFINDKYSISLADDHMKYVVDPDQVVEMTGTISEIGRTYDGEFDGDEVVLDSDFLSFEHTDGLNYINVRLERCDVLLDFNKFSRANIKVNYVLGAEVGVLIPKTNARLMFFERHDAFHFSGFGESLYGGINLCFGDKFFIQTELKGGMMQIPWIRTTPSKSDGAKQNVLFYQNNILFGSYFTIGGPEKKAKRKSKKVKRLEKRTVKAELIN